MKQARPNSLVPTAGCRRTAMGRLLLTTLLLFTFLGGTRADEVTVGDGTATCNTNPIGTYYNYSITEQLYTADEIGMAGTITSVSFYYMGIAAKDFPITVYMKHVDEENLASAGISLADATEVFNGTLSVPATAGWVTINLETPFAYDGTSNLLIGINKDYLYYFSGQSWQGTATTSTMARYTQNDNNAYNTTNTVPGTTQANRPNIKLDITDGGGPICAKPTGLTVNYTGGTEATVSWTSSESLFDIDVNGTVTEDVTNPYTLTGLEFATTYTIKVRAKNTGGVSKWSNPVSFNTDFSDDMCQIQLVLTDSYGDGWTGSAIQITDVLSGIVIGTYANTNEASANEAQVYYANVPNGRDIQFQWISGSYDSECSYIVYDVEGDEIFSGSNAMSAPVSYTVDCSSQWRKPTNLSASEVQGRSAVLSWTENSPTPATAWVVAYKAEGASDFTEVNAAENPFTLTGLSPETEYTVKVRPITDDSSIKWSAEITFTTDEVCPKPTSLAATQVGTTTAVVGWDGTHDSYLLQYRTAAQDMDMSVWHQVGNDIVTSHTLTQYTFDLSAYAGQTGSIAIRHYDVSDMFKVAIDDIVVTDAGGTEVFSEDFESGSIPAGWTNKDYDGDGYLWNIASFTGDGYQHGSYSASSDSYYNYVGPLFPDNWLIIPNVELGGTLTFYAMGVDNQGYHLENLGVFVTTESYDAIPAGEWSSEIPTTGKSYQLTGLTANTPYDWRVKGISGTEESSWAESVFTTIQDGFKTFVNAGNWDVAANWFPEGVPSITDEVSITKAVTIPANVVAQAKKATIETGGSVTIEDGGQLKQGSATLKVTMKKVIPGYTPNGTDGWHFISSPFSGNTVIGTSDNWSHVLNLTDSENDLYGFYPTDEDEWINYKADSQHDVFFAGSNTNFGLINKRGYLYANTADETILEFNGTAVSGINNSMNMDFSYDATSTDPFNGWALVGNPYTCNGYLMFGDDGGNLINATFYKMNAAGNGYVKYENYVMLAPGEGAFVEYNTSGKVWYYSDDQGWTIASSGTATLPIRPIHGLSTSQDASNYNIVLADNATDNSATVDAYNGLDANVTLQGRTLYKDGKWNTLCLPFALTAEQVETVLESPTALMELDVTSTESDGTTYKTRFDGSTLYLQFADATSISPRVPYIIKWEGTDGTIENPLFSGVTIDVTGLTPTYASADGKVTFTGSFDYRSFTDEDRSILFLGGDDTLYYPEAGASIGAFRAYFELASGVTVGDPANAIRAFVLNFGDGETTGVNSLTPDPSPRGEGSGYYTLDGRKLDGQPTRKGLYIHNGRVVVIK